MSTKEFELCPVARWRTRTCSIRARLRALDLLEREVQDPAERSRLAAQIEKIAQRAEPVIR